jgi:hypothetical protein
MLAISCSQPLTFEKYTYNSSVSKKGAEILTRVLIWGNGQGSESRAQQIVKNQGLTPIH